MKEKTLINFLITVGLVCLVIIIVSQAYISTSLGKIIPKMIPRFICQKDKDGYILAKPTSTETCEKINDIPIVIKPEFCKLYEGESKTACLELTTIMQERREDCFWVLFKREKTTVNPTDVENYCQILENQ